MIRQQFESYRGEEGLRGNGGVKLELKCSFHRRRNSKKETDECPFVSFCFHVVSFLC